MRIIIATNASTSTVASKNALTAFLEAKGWSVWHWYDDLWLIDDVPDEINLIALREEIRKAIPTLPYFMTMAAEGPINHAGMVRKESLEWFKQHWMRNR